jgi:hypothetical protein
VTALPPSAMPATNGCASAPRARGQLKTAGIIAAANDGLSTMPKGARTALVLIDVHCDGKGHRRPDQNRARVRPNRRPSAAIQSRIATSTASKPTGRQGDAAASSVRLVTLIGELAITAARTAGREHRWWPGANDFIGSTAFRAANSESSCAVPFPSFRNANVTRSVNLLAKAGRAKAVMRQSRGKDFDRHHAPYDCAKGAGVARRPFKSLEKSFTRDRHDGEILLGLWCKSNG